MYLFIAGAALQHCRSKLLSFLARIYRILYFDEEKLILWYYTSRHDCGIKKRGPARVRTGVAGNFQIGWFQKPEC